MLYESTTILDMAPLIDPDELIGATEVAPIIGLTNPKGVPVYRQRHADFPVPAVDRAGCVLWLRADVEKWARLRTRLGRIETWWSALSAERRTEASAVGGYVSMPTWMMESLARAGVMVAGAKWESDPGYTFHLPDDVEAFIAAQVET